MKDKTFYTALPSPVDYQEVPGGTIVFFRQNIKDAGADPVSGEALYQADEYSVVMLVPIAVAIKRIEVDYDLWLNRAMSDDADDGTDVDAATILMELAADHEERLCLLELEVG